MSDSLPATTRAMASVPPPGGNGTTRRTKRLGHVCACARVARAGAKTAAEVVATRRRRLIIAVSDTLFDLEPGLLDHGSPLADFDFEHLAKLVGCGTA